MTPSPSDRALPYTRHDNIEATILMGTTVASVCRVAVSRLQVSERFGWGLFVTFQLLATTDLSLSLQ